MERVFWLGRKLAGLVLILILIAPVAVASDTPGSVDADLWDQFLAWVEAQLTVPTGVAAEDDGFTAWLMARISIPPG